MNLISIGATWEAIKKLKYPQGQGMGYCREGKGGPKIENQNKREDICKALPFGGKSYHMTIYESILLSKCGIVCLLKRDHTLSLAYQRRFFYQYGERI